MHEPDPAAHNTVCFLEKEGSFERKLDPLSPCAIKLVFGSFCLYEEVVIFLVSRGKKERC